jgi:hypothetical protein
VFIRMGSLALEKGRGIRRDIHNYREELRDLAV